MFDHDIANILCIPEVERNEGDDESVESLQVCEPDEMPEAPAPTQTSEPSSRPARTRNAPDLLSPKMTGQRSISSHPEKTL